MPEDEYNDVKEDDMHNDGINLVCEKTHTFTVSYPSCTALSIDSMTFEWPLRLVMNSNLAGIKVSKQILKVLRPHSFQSCWEPPGEDDPVEGDPQVVVEPPE